MTNQEWQGIIDATFAMVQKISASKGKEYSRDSEDLLDNFKRYGQASGVPSITAWMVLFGKHVDSITMYVRDQTAVHMYSAKPRVWSEPIEGRIDDAIVYLMLLKGIIAEDKGKN